MKVLFVNTVANKGSTGRIIYDIGKQLEKNGGEFIIAYGRGEKIQDKHFYRISNNLGVYSHALFSRITDKSGFYSKLSTYKFIKFIKKINPDIIHLNNLHGYYINVEILFNFLKNEYKGKIVWTLHDCWSFTGHCVHYSYAQCDKWKTGCKNCPEKHRYPSSYFLDNSKNNYFRKKKAFTNISDLTIVTPSEWLKNQVENSFLKSYPVYVINNGIDLNKFKRIEGQSKNKQNVLLNVVDGIDDRKGFNDLLLLSKKLPDNYIIKIVGVKFSEIRRDNKIEFIERTESIEELVMYYNQAKYLVNPTYEDTFPTVNLEALACGLPVITYQSGGSPEAIQDGCGVVIKPGDIENLLNSVIKDYGDSDKCINCAKKYSKDLKYNEYIKLYRQLLNGEKN